MNYCQVDIRMDGTTPVNITIELLSAMRPEGLKHLKLTVNSDTLAYQLSDNGKNGFFIKTSITKDQQQNGFVSLAFHLLETTSFHDHDPANTDDLKRGIALTGYRLSKV